MNHVSYVVGWKPPAEELFARQPALKAIYGAGVDAILAMNSACAYTDHPTKKTQAWRCQQMADTRFMARDSPTSATNTMRIYHASTRCALGAA
jgi:hypothetical protein